MGKLKTKLISEASSPPQADLVDRIILKREERDKLDRWLEGLTEKYDGMIKFSKSDLANFLIRQHSENLSELEAKLLGAEHYDEMRWINRAIEKIRQAKRSGAQLTLEELMTKRKPIEKIKSSLLKRKTTQRDQGVNNKLYTENQVDPSADEIL